MKEELKNRDKVCENCGEFSGPGIIECPNCHSRGFRNLTEEEINGPPRLVYRKNFIPTNNDNGRLARPMTNIFTQ